MDAEAAVMAEPGSLERRRVTLPDPGPDDALLRVEVNGICGTDVHMYGGGMDLDDPLLPGHEFTGVVEHLGEDVNTDATGTSIKEGDWLTVVPGIYYGGDWYAQNMPARPPLSTDRDVYGFLNAEGTTLGGGLCEYAVLTEDATYYRLPDGLDRELGALTEPLSVAMHAVERAVQPGLPSMREGFGTGRSVAVQGAGPIGLLCVAAARAAGAGQIIAIDAIDDRLGMAGRFGATETVDLTAHDDDESLYDAVHDLTSGGVGPDVVVEAAGVPQAFRQALELVHDGGSVVEAGHYAYSGEVKINPTRIVQKELDIYGSMANPPGQFETALSLLNRWQDRIPFGDLLNFGVGLDNVTEAYERQAEGKAYRATVHPQQ
jgi:L-iditol 2-dehydrogenase